MSNKTKPRVSLLDFGRVRTPIVDILIKLEELETVIISSNLLDFDLPNPEGSVINHYPLELMNVLHQTTKNIKENFPVPSKIKSEIDNNQHLPFNLSSDEVDILYNINLIEKSSNSLIKAYDILEGQTRLNNIDLYPLITKEIQLNIFQKGKWAPLRYYVRSGEIPFSEDDWIKICNTRGIEECKKGMLQSDVKQIYGLELLNDAKLDPRVVEVFSNSDLLLFSFTDLLSYLIFFSSKQLYEQIKKAAPLNKSVFIFDKNLLKEPTDRELELISLLKIKPKDASSLFTDKLAELCDYVIVEEESSFTKMLRENGLKVLQEFYSQLSTVDQIDDLYKSEFLSNLFNIAKIDLAGLKPQINKNNNSSSPTNPSDKAETVESNNSKIDKDSSKNENTDGDTQANGVETIQKEEKLEKPENGSEIPASTIVEEVQEEHGFSPDESETLEETLNRALSALSVESITDVNRPEIQWILSLCDQDHEKEVQVLSFIMNKFINIESFESKRKYVSLLGLFYDFYRQTMVQIATKEINDSIESKSEEILNNYGKSFQILRDEIPDFAERIVKNVVTSVCTIKDDPVVNELGKVTVLQLVLPSKNLSRIAISGILTMLSSNPNSPPPELWNILTGFSGSMVGVEMITNFTKDTAEELIRKSALLRYTGSYITTINKILNAWSSGDSNLVSSLAGGYLPNQTLRKLERLELARNIKRLRTIPLETLADISNMDTKTIESMIAEMALKDNLNVKMEMIDNRMIVVYEGSDEDI